MIVNMDDRTLINKSKDDKDQDIDFGDDVIKNFH